ncbi:MAG: hypothetical protein RL095_2801 [Verrucomicrobiota bacterium]|jgi:hypothetical protein
MTQPSRRTPPTSSQANLTATSSRGRVDKNTKSTSKALAKKPGAKGRPAEDNTKLYIGIGVGGGLFLLLIMIAAFSGPDKKPKRVQQATNAPAKTYDPLESYKNLSVTQRMAVYREGLAIDVKVAAEMAKVPMTGDRVKDAQRHQVEAGIQGRLESELMSKHKLNRQSYDKINSDGVNNGWK